MAPDRERAFAAGVDDYLSKPVFLEDLEAALSRVLSGDAGTTVDVVAAGGRSNGWAGRSTFDATIVAELRKIRGPGKPDLFSDLAARFLDHMPESLEEITSAVSQGDVETVRRLAHKLLGVCRQIGAERMARICVQLESIDAASQSLDVTRELEFLHVEFDTARRELRERFLS